MFRVPRYVRGMSGMAYGKQQVKNQSLPTLKNQGPVFTQ